MAKYLSCAETAKLIRQSLKEAFPNVKFSVRSSVYSGGASINVSWTDGPNARQVEELAKGFAGGYFDGSIDYKGSVYHMNNEGEQVNMGADFVFCHRKYSDASVQRAIDAVYRKYEGNFKKDGIAKPTLEQYRNGDLMRVQLSGLHFYGGQDVQHEVRQVMDKHSDRLAVAKSPTASKYFITHDDGYSLKCGSGRSVIPTENRT